MPPSPGEPPVPPDPGPPVVMTGGVAGSDVAELDAELPSDPEGGVVDVLGIVTGVVEPGWIVVVDPRESPVATVVVVVSSPVSLDVVVVDGAEVDVVDVDVVEVDVVEVDVVEVDGEEVDDVVAAVVVVVVASAATPRISTLSMWADAPSDKTDDVMNRTPVVSER